MNVQQKNGDFDGTNPELWSWDNLSVQEMEYMRGEEQSQPNHL